MKSAQATPRTASLCAARRFAAACSLVVMIALGLTACPSDNQNPERLWLSLDGVETRVHLVAFEPEPF